jgi:hypothetical protein
MDNERDPNRQNEETADANEEAVTGRADGEEEFEDTDDIDEGEDADTDADADVDTTE